METKTDENEDRHHEVQILVNDRPVIMTERKANGVEIKQAAIKQGVPIKLDFVLSVVGEDGRTHLVRDHEEVKLHPGQHFVAIPGDDNS